MYGGSSIKLAIASGLVCVMSWVALALAAGNEGLQRSVSSAGPLTLLERPIAILVPAAVALAAAALLARSIAPVRPTQMLKWVLVGDAVGSIVIAPVLIGELNPLNAPITFVVLAVLGTQPLAAFAGAWAGARGSRR